jgi:GAF domain-containing protein
MSLHPLKREGSCVGVLCIGQAARDSAETEQLTVGAGDFADRLSLILTSIKQAERLRYQANYDSLTGLQNRRLFADSVNAAMATGLCMSTSTCSNESMTLPATLPATACCG